MCQFSKSELDRIQKYIGVLNDEIDFNNKTKLKG